MTSHVPFASKSLDFFRRLDFAVFQFDVTAINNYLDEFTATENGIPPIKKHYIRSALVF
jgi:hypothetical protein